MTVYVDDVRHRYGRMVMCHMTADTLDELHAFASRLGLRRRWFQGPPYHRHAHYDLCQQYRERAVRLGAVTVSRREMARRARALAGPMGRDFKKSPENDVAGNSLGTLSGGIT